MLDRWKRLIEEWVYTADFDKVALAIMLVYFGMMLCCVAIFWSVWTLVY